MLDSEIRDIAGGANSAITVVNGLDDSIVASNDGISGRGVELEVDDASLSNSSLIENKGALGICRE